MCFATTRSVDRHNPGSLKRECLCVVWLMFPITLEKESSNKAARRTLVSGKHYSISCLSTKKRSCWKPTGAKHPLQTLREVVPLPGITVSISIILILLRVAFKIMLQLELNVLQSILAVYCITAFSHDARLIFAVFYCIFHIMIRYIRYLSVACMGRSQQKALTLLHSALAKVLCTPSFFVYTVSVETFVDKS